MKRAGFQAVRAHQDIRSASHLDSQRAPVGALDKNQWKIRQGTTVLNAVQIKGAYSRVPRHPIFPTRNRFQNRRPKSFVFERFAILQIKENAR
jgi:hypothetical protein